jgi:NADH-quinone oxidoreductase subunit N
MLELILLLGILSLLLLQSFDLYHPKLPLVLLLMAAITLFFQSFTFNVFMQLLTLIIAFWVIFSFEKKDQSFGVLLLLSLLGSILAISSKNWLNLYLSLELMALPLYAMSAMNKKQVLSQEAALKYFVMGSIGSIIMLFGISYIYMATGSLMIHQPPIQLFDFYAISGVLILTGIFVKLGLAPFHHWVPDIYQTAPLGVVAWIAMVPKIVLLTVLSHLLLLDAPLFAPWMIKAISIISIVYGAVMAVMQDNIRRLLAYASIVHLGVMTIPLIFDHQGMAVMIFYLLAYLLMNVALFASIHIFELEGIQKISELTSLGYHKYYESLLFSVTLVSLAGIPPFTGFVAKINVLYLLLSHQNFPQALAVLFASGVGGYYYLNIVRLMYQKGLDVERKTNVINLIYIFPLLLFSIFSGSILIWVSALKI